MVGETTYFTSFASNFLFHNNLHVVAPGRFYRSAQMSREDIQSTIQRLGIRTVIDLRLNNDEPDASGRTQRETVERQGATYLHIPFSSARANQIDRLQNLVRAYESSPRPILVHCSSGTHRSGVASAVWLLDRENAPIETALEQITLRYGFIQWERDLKALFQGEPTLDTVLTDYAKAAAAEPLTFREWLERQPLTGQYGE